MARIVVRFVDHLDDRGQPNTERFRRGDVVAVVADGHEFSKRELANPARLIVDFPGVSVDRVSWMVDYLTDDEKANIQAARSRGEDVAVPQRLRAYRFSEAAILALRDDVAVVQAFKADPTRDRALTSALAERFDGARAGLKNASR